MRIALINPNTSVLTTKAMVRLAREELDEGVALAGYTAPFGSNLITDTSSLRIAADAVTQLLPAVRSADAVIVAAFGDPGRQNLAGQLDIPVTGIAEAGMAEAAEGGRRFAVVTTTPDLCDAIALTAQQLGHDTFAGTWTTSGDPQHLMCDQAALEQALSLSIEKATQEGEADVVVIGGGPLAIAARSLAGGSRVPLIEPVPAAVRLSLARLRERRG